LLPGVGSSYTVVRSALCPAVETLGGILRVSAPVASNLLTTQRDTVVLHGDMHHGNVLNFG